MENVNAHHQEQAEHVDCVFSLVICTLIRADSLRDALRTAVEQEPAGRFDYEVLVVDNNSTNGTRAVVEVQMPNADGRLRYLHDGRRGKSFALNLARSFVAGEFYTIVDDDVILTPNCLAGLYHGILRHPGASFYSGRVLPQWSSSPPAWLTQEHRSAIAMADYGESEFTATREKPICLLACTFRTSDVRSAGGNDVRLGVKAEQTGGVEDLELLQSLWEVNKGGWSLRGVAFLRKAEPDWLSKRTHRRWHPEDGRSHAVMHDSVTERSVKVFGVPRFQFRDVLESALEALNHTLAGRASPAFVAETRLWLLLGYGEQRGGVVGTGGPASVKDR